MSRITISELFPMYATALKWYTLKGKEHVRLQKEYGIYLPKGKVIALLSVSYSTRYVGTYDNFFSLKRKILAKYKKIIDFEVWASYDCRYCTSINFPIEEIARYISIGSLLLRVLSHEDFDYNEYELELHTLNT